MVALSWPTKDPDEILDYQLDWSKRLLGDTITACDWSVPIGLTRNASYFDGQITTVWLGDGALGETYTVTNTIETAAGRTMQQSVKLKILAK
jgi:hypothetical protein